MKAEVGPASTRPSSAACSTSPTTSSTARSCIRRAVVVARRATTRTSSSRPTRGPRPSRTRANAISAEYGFWLGDAFASGGSTGYDHKKLGITARGAWESVKRHFRELGTDVMNEPFTVVGDRRHVGRRVRQRAAVLGPDLPGRGVRPPARVRRPGAEPGRGVRRAQAAVRAARLELGRLRPLEDLGGRRRVAAFGQVDRDLARDAARARDGRRGARRRAS